MRTVFISFLFTLLDINLSNISTFWSSSDDPEVMTYFVEFYFC